MRLFLSLFISLFFTLCPAQSSLSSFSSLHPPKHEVRAVWLTTIGGIDWPHNYAQSTRSIQVQQKELTTILDKLQKAGINTILLQTRIRGTVIYPSRYEPWDGCLSGKPGVSPGYDALAFAIDECHKRGMELHAWVVTIPIGKWNAMSSKRLRQSHPGMLRKIGDEGYMNPELGATGDYLANICEEIAGNYDVDGIHLDYIRYPETWPIKVSNTQGRQFITNIVRKIHSKVKARKPWIKMSCSPIGKADDLSRYWSHGWNAYTRVCQDAQGWLKEGLMDELFPMMYFKDNNFFPFAIDWKEQSNGRIVVPGLGIYFMSPKEKNWNLESITREMAVTRNYRMGHAFFRSKFFTDNVKGIYSFTTDLFNASPALIPPMTWASGEQPAVPQNIGISHDNQVIKLSVPHGDRFTYNLYASKTWPIDISQGLHLMKTQASYEILPNDGHFYAVTRMDRYGNESNPFDINPQTTSRPLPTQGLLPHNGKQLLLPDYTKQADAEFILITSLTGQIIQTLPAKGDTLNISSLTDGIYQVRTLNKRHVSHRIGFLKIKK